MEIKYFQKGFNYAQDGRGNRLVIHLQGCNLHCPWCANPESMAPGGELMVHKEQLVPGVCPHGAIADKAVNREICKTCTERECLFKYKNKGITCPMQKTEVSELYNEIAGCRPLFFDGGGVTLTGGEPTMQFEEGKELLSLCKEGGIHTATETNATHPRLHEWFSFIDELIMDCKHYDGEVHRNVTGIGSETIFSNLRAAFEGHKNVLVHIPLIGGFNAGEADADGFAKLFSSMNPKENVRFEVLPYHEYGKEKWLECGFEYTMKETAYISDKTRKMFEQTLQNAGLTVVRT